MAAPKEILDLLERFDRNRETYRSGNYNETQLRREFLDLFFKALGWDIDNAAGHAEAYKDVIHEDAIKVGGATKAPDYCFRIGGTRKFFVEAKKPSVNIAEDIGPAYQLRRYAWSAKLPLSILTDFEEFAVYDCRIKPDKTDKASTARIMYLTDRDYPARWEEIAAIFSKDAVLKGSFDKYADTARLKKGTAGVDAAFLKEIETWRDILARNVALRNAHLTQRELNAAVTLTINRIIFLRICEDRGIETYGQLMALKNGSDIYARLIKIYYTADDKYNSGLFHFRAERDRPASPDTLTLNLAIDDRTLKDIFGSLYYPDSPYEFSVLPADILGQVYEQFLGKIIHLTAGHRAKVEDKPEVKKAGGVYYTPTYIVDYIVKNTVGKLLSRNSDGVATAAKSRKTITPKQAAEIRILDPACGSGSFLLGAYQYLLDWHLAWYLDHEPAKWLNGKSPVLCQGPGGDRRLTTSERKRILLNNIYGVDIDAQAVEVTKLSLLLKVLEGENEQTLSNQLRLFRERALPDLANNIKCGNSLIGPDFYDNQQTGFFDDEERYRINVFDWKAEFPEIFTSKSPSPPAGEGRGEGGFDAVIGNPPYGAYLDDNGKMYLTTKFKHQSYQLDSYLLFLEQSVKLLLSQEGFYGMIIPNPWLTNLLQKKIRKFVVENSRIREIVHFRFPVFPKVVVDTEILILQKWSPKDWTAIITIVESLDAFLPPFKGIGIRRIEHGQQKWRDLDGGVINIFTNSSEEALAIKCSASKAPLGSLSEINVGIKPYQVGKGKPPQTREIVASRPYDSDHPIDSSYQSYLRGSDIARYKIAPLKKRYLKYGPWLAEPRPAAKFNAPVKIVMRQTGDKLVAALDIEQYLCLNNMHVIVPLDSKLSCLYLLGIINSKLMNWYYQVLNPEVGEALAEIKKTNVAKLPIKSINFSDPADKARHDQMVALVEQMLSLHKKLAETKTDHEKTNLQRQIEATDRRIDRLVYELYELTEEEVGIVEGTH